MKQKEKWADEFLDELQHAAGSELLFRKDLKRIWLAGFESGKDVVAQFAEKFVDNKDLGPAVIREIGNGDIKVPRGSETNEPK